MGGVKWIRASNTLITLCSSRDSQVAEVALSLSDFNPVAKMAPNPDLLSEMRQGAGEEVG